MERIKYIDNVKGYLILVVIFHHVLVTINSVEKYKLFWDDGLQTLSVFRMDYLVSFFMPCFFVINGMVSNFKKDFSSFLTSSAKSLVFPTLFFGTGWFVYALFVARIFVYCLFNVKKLEKLNNIYFFCVLFFIVSLISHMFPFLRYNYYLLHPFGLSIFIFIGTKYSKLTRLVKLIFVAFFLILSTYYFIKNKCAPHITVLYDVDLFTVMPCLLLSLGGSISFVEIVKNIRNVKIVEYFGKVSLIVYLTHQFFINSALNIAAFFHETYGYNVFMNKYYIVLYVFVLSSASCLCLCKILDTRYLKWICGKF